MSLITELWFAFPGYVLDRKELTDQIMKQYKKAARDRNRMLRIAAISILFRLLDTFSEEKNPVAPGMLKTLIFSLVENPHDTSIREHYYTNFKELFEKHETIPISLLVEPYLNQIMTNEDEPFYFKNFDFEFFTYLCKHPKMNLQMAMSMINLFSKIYLEDHVYSSIAKVPLHLLIKRYYLEHPV